MAGLDVSPITQLLGTIGNRRRITGARGGDENALNSLLATNPQMGQFVMQEQQAQQAATQKAQADREALFTSKMLAAPLEQRAQLLELGVQQGLVDGDDYQAYTDSLQNPLEMQNKEFSDHLMIGGYGKLISSGDTAVLGESQRLVDTTTGRTIVDAKNSLEKSLKNETEFFKRTNETRNQIRKADPDFIKSEDAYTRVKASAKDPSAAGDLALIFNFMKVLDPGSTVREGEFANAQNAGGLDAKVTGLYNQVMNGKRLTPEQRSDFVGRSDKLFTSAKNKHLKRIEPILKTAEKYGVPRADILGGQQSDVSSMSDEDLLN